MASAPRGKHMPPDPLAYKLQGPAVFMSRYEDLALLLLLIAVWVRYD